MRNASLILLLCLICLGVGGCGVTGEVENQAYALVMGVDAKDGGIELTIRIPRIGRSGKNDEQSGGSGEDYLLISAAGDDFARARENLQWAVARELNLSHLKLLIVSEALASDARFPSLIREIAETRHLYTTAGFVVCEGRAGDFIEGQETLLGSHLSGDIDAMFRHYAAHGYIPSARFADLYYDTLSCYSDPVGIWGFPDGGERPAAAVIESDERVLNAKTQTASSRQYLGTALFRDGVLVGKLDAAETLCLNLLTHRVDAFSFEAAGRTWSLSSVRGPKVTLHHDGNTMRIHVKLSLACEESGDLTSLESTMEEAMNAVVGKCQRLRVEPFGFAAKAAARFPTLGAWQAFDWRNRFPECAFEAEVDIVGPEV